MLGFFVLFTYVELLDKTFYLNHYYFVSLLSFLLVFLPLNARLALDVRLGVRPRQARVPAWTLYAVRLQLALVYVFAGVAKLTRTGFSPRSRCGFGSAPTPSCRSSARFLITFGCLCDELGGDALRPDHPLFSPLAQNAPRSPTSPSSPFTCSRRSFFPSACFRESCW